MFNVKKTAKNLLAVGLCVSLASSMISPTAWAYDESPTFVTAAKANHWGRSDMRAYLNNVTKTNGTLPVDSTTSGSNSANYPSQFSNREYDLVQAQKCTTNVLDTNAAATSTYETTDKFWLPSGNYASNKFISWGKEDLSANAQCTESKTNDKERLIPISYWAYGTSKYSWLRSPYYTASGANALGTSRGSYVAANSVNYTYAAAAAFKVNLASVIFSSAASAASFAAEGGAKKIDIAGSANFGKKVEDALPDYGMYLKTKSKNSFTANEIALANNSLTVKYAGGVADKYVMVQAFKADDLENGTSSYVAAGKIASADSSVSIDVTDWGLSSLDGYTIKVWMEDNTGSLAAATEPVTFVGSADAITKTDAGAVANARVFALKADLKTSWGTLANATDLVGTDPTNQKIYYGKDSTGAPLEFWIAGRETNGTIDASGNTMCLYQAKSVYKRTFKPNTTAYKAIPTLNLQDNQSTAYTGEAVTFPGTVSLIDPEDNTRVEESYTVTYECRASGSLGKWTTGMPTAGGQYEIRAKSSETDTYSATTSDPVDFEITAATPTYSVPTLTNKVTALYGQTLGEIKSQSQLKELLGSPRFNDTEIAGTWSWADGTTHPSGDAGTRNFTAHFKPADGVKDNYDWEKLSQWDKNYERLSVNVPVTVKALPMGINSVAVSGSFTYNGKVQTPTITIKNGSSTTLKENTDYTVTFTGDKKSAGEQEIKINFQGNYSNLSDTPVVTKYNIAPATLKVGSATATNKTYDGKTDAKISAVNFTGVVTGESLILNNDYTVSGDFDNANVGTSKTVTATVVLNNTNVAKNYSLSQSNSTITAKANITPAALKIGSATAESKTYDGTTNAKINELTLTGAVNNEKLNLDTDYTVSGAFKDANAGTNKAVTVTVTLKDTGIAKNYTLSKSDATKEVNADINRKAVNVTAENKSKIYGAKDPELTYVIDAATPLIDKETLTGKLAREEGEAPGAYSILPGTLTNDNNQNYYINFVNGKFTIVTDTAEWGKKVEYDGITHYVDDEGKTSVEISAENTDENGIIWLKEESDGTSAWYGLKDTSGVFQNGSRFYVKWLSANDAEYNELLSQIDDNKKQEQEDDNGWIFQVGVIKPDGTRYENLTDTVDFYVQIGDDWDKEDLEAVFIKPGDDEDIEVTFEDNVNCLGTEDTFGVMKLNHFSPYYIYDKLNDQEKAEREKAANEEKLNAEQAALLAAGKTSKTGKGGKSVKTGDEITNLTISSLELIMTLALGLMMKVNSSKRKFD